jgi:hypothetical protein
MLSCLREILSKQGVSSSFNYLNTVCNCNWLHTLNTDLGNGLVQRTFSKLHKGTHRDQVRISAVVVYVYSFSIQR